MNRRKYIRTVGIAGAGTLTGLSTTAAAVPRQRVVGYYPAWGRGSGYTPEAVPFSKLTHVIYAFVQPESDGTVEYIVPERDTENMDRLADRKGDTSLLLSVGGWTASKHFSDAAHTRKRRRRFAETAVSMMRRHDFDGIDIDWEYPGGGGAPGNTSRSGDPHRFTLLMRAIRSRLNDAESADGRSYELTFAAPTLSKVGRYESSALAGLVSHVNVMTYDYAGGWRDVAAHNAPLYASGDDSPKGRLNAATGMAGWSATAVPDSKLVMGVPFFGRVFTDVTRGDRDGLFESFGGVKGTFGYDRIKREYIDDPNYWRDWDRDSEVAWHFGENTFVTHPDPDSVGTKGRFVADSSYGGVMIWELSQDVNESLLDTVRSGLGV